MKREFANQLLAEIALSAHALPGAIAELMGQRRRWDMLEQQELNEAQHHITVGVLLLQKCALTLTMEAQRVRLGEAERGE